MRVVVVGAGALGSHLVLLLRNLGLDLQVVDFDRIEAKNILSQFHTKQGLSKNKAQALQAAMAGLFGSKLGISTHRLTTLNVDALLQGAGLVVDCVDNAETRLILQGWTSTHKVPCLHGALAANGEFGQVMWDPLFTPDQGAGGATCEDGAHLPFIALVAAQMAFTVQQFVLRGTCRSVQVLPNGNILPVG